VSHSHASEATSIPADHGTHPHFHFGSHSHSHEDEHSHRESDSTSDTPPADHDSDAVYFVTVDLVSPSNSSSANLVSVDTSVWLDSLIPVFQASLPLSPCWARFHVPPDPGGGRSVYMLTLSLRC